MTWAVMPAAGRGSRLGGEVPKQYMTLAGRPMIEHSLRALLGHPDVDGVMVALAPDDPWWGGWRYLENKPIYTCIGGAERAGERLRDAPAARFCSSDPCFMCRRFLLLSCRGRE